MTAERLRQRALLCLRFATASEDPDVAARLKLMAGEYLIEAEELEEAPGFAPPRAHAGSGPTRRDGH